MAVKYVALDVHQASTAASVRDHRGRVVRRQILPTTATSLIQFIGGIRGPIHLTFEEGTLAQWLHDLLSSRVERLIVCVPRQNLLLLRGNKTDQVDADKSIPRT